MTFSRRHCCFRRAGRPALPARRGGPGGGGPGRWPRAVPSLHTVSYPAGRPPPQGCHSTPPARAWPRRPRPRPPTAPVTSARARATRPGPRGRDRPGGLTSRGASLPPFRSTGPGAGGSPPPGRAGPAGGGKPLPILTTVSAKQRSHFLPSSESDMFPTGARLSPRPGPALRLQASLARVARGSQARKPRGGVPDIAR